MTQEKVLARFLDTLKDFGIEYMVTGSIASIRYGRPRLTHDMDIVLVFKTEQVEKLLKELGGDFSPDIDTIREMVKSAGMFEIMHSRTGLKIDCWNLTDTEYEKESFGRRKKLNFAETQAYFSTPEDIILSKLLWQKKGASEKHLEDIKGILEVQVKLDRRYMQKWAEKLGVLEIWENLKK